MNTNKIFAYILVGIIGGLNILQAVVPFLPPVWADLVNAILALAAAYHVVKSHSPVVLAGEGYTRN